MTNKIDDILAERGKRYGNFNTTAETAQYIKGGMRSNPEWQHLKPSQIEALEQIATKISRIIHGDPNYKDSWDDIAGYAQLATEETTR